MKHLFVSLTLFLSLGFIPAQAQKACGTERWPVKTLQDSTANQIKPEAKPATVKYLVSQAAPKRKPPITRLTGVETTTWKVYGWIKAYKIEIGKTGDHDMHIVFQDANDPTITMIAEIPDASCAPTRYAEIFRQERLTILKLGRPHGSKLLTLSKPIPATFTGIGFFDKIHGQDGVAPNGVELHPLLSVEIHQ